MKFYNKDDEKAIFEAFIILIGSIVILGLNYGFLQTFTGFFLSSEICRWYRRKLKKKNSKKKE